MHYMKAPANVRADWTVYEGLGLGEPVADVHGTEDRARLIAKAPDLRDALQNLLTAIHHRENNPGFASAGTYVRALERARALLED